MNPIIQGQTVQFAGRKKKNPLEGWKPEERTTTLPATKEEQEYSKKNSDPMRDWKVREQLEKTMNEIGGDKKEKKETLEEFLKKELYDKLPKKGQTPSTESKKDCGCESEKTLAKKYAAKIDELIAEFRKLKQEIENGAP